MRQTTVNNSNSGYYHYNLYQAYYPMHEEGQHPLPAHIDAGAEIVSPSRCHLNSLSKGERTVILHRIAAELGYPETETEIKAELWPQA